MSNLTGASIKTQTSYTNSNVFTCCVNCRPEVPLKYQAQVFCLVASIIKIFESLTVFFCFFFLLHWCLFQAFETPPTFCYSFGDFILRACPVGFSELNNGSKIYSSAVCLADNVWSDPDPLHCARQHCGPPPEFENAEVVGKSTTGTGNHVIIQVFVIKRSNLH